MKEWLIDPLLSLVGKFAGPSPGASDWSIIIPVKDQPELTARCFDSVLRNAADAEIIAVNDASEEAETAAVLSRFESSGGIVISNSQAEGHTRATHRGVDISTRPLLCLLNNDTVLTASALTLLGAALDEATVGSTGPTTSRCATEQTNSYAEWRRWKWTDQEIDGFSTYMRRRCRNQFADLDYVGGFAFCIRREVWDQFGGFNLRLPDYGNEKELCKRLANSGLKQRWVKDAYVHHLGNASYGQYGDDEVKRLRRRGEEIMRSLPSRCESLT